MADLTYADVEQYLRTYTTDCPPYDFNGLLQLVLTAVDNLRENHIEGDLEDYGPTISPEVREFLTKLLAYAGNGERA